MTLLKQFADYIITGWATWLQLGASLAVLILLLAAIGRFLARLMDTINARQQRRKRH